jgi:translation initiation factor 4E
MAAGGAGYLSFNRTVYQGSFNLPDEDPEFVEACRAPLRLKHRWVLWEQGSGAVSYTDATRKVVTFETCQEFWAVWNGLPQPSELLDGKRITRELQHGATVGIDAIMIFKDGIAPEWEDPANATGGHFQIQLKPQLGGGQIDEYWNNIVLAVVGNTIEHGEYITGIRLVDKLSGPKTTSAVRIELWYKQCNAAQQAALLKSMERHLAVRLSGEHGTVPKPENKTHSSMKH